MTEPQVTLTASEREKLRQQAEKAMRERLSQRRPDSKDYATETNRASQMIGSTLLWSRAAVPVIALLAAIASSVRTVQVVSTIYSDAGSHQVGVLLAAVAFTLAAEGALFTLALARAGEDLKRRSEGRERHVASLAGLWRAIRVRIGVDQPLRHDQMPEATGQIGTVLMLALAFTLSTNLYLGMKPLIDQTGSSSLQNFIATLWTASAQVQMTFFVDLAAALFAPLVAFSAGHLTAHFAAEVAQQSQAGRRAYERDLEQWRAAHADPLSTDEGRELFEEHERLKIESKQARQEKADARRRQKEQEDQQTDFLSNGNGSYRTVTLPGSSSTNGNGHN